MNRDARFERALHEARKEFKRAVAKHGDNVPDSPTTGDLNRLGTLGEEYGEVCRAMTYDKDHAGELAKELIQTGTMALAWAALLLADDSFVQTTPELLEIRAHINAIRENRNFVVRNDDYVQDHAEQIAKLAGAK